jgi:type VII secretion-associated serine protease mycosin
MALAMGMAGVTVASDAAAAHPPPPAAARSGSLVGVAPDRCQPAPAAPFTEPSWPLRRYPPDRLAPIADGRGVTVAVIDSGVDTSHPQLAGAVARGRDFLDPGGDGTLDCVGHGTAVASIIAARPVNGVAFRGLAPAARILPVRVTEQQVIDGKKVGQKGTPAGLAAAVRWAVDQKVDVINLSVVMYDENNRAVEEAIAEAVANDVVVVAAVGNLHEKGNPRPYPAAYDAVLGVGAIGATGQREPYSQVGPYVDVTAPGGKVIAAAPIRGHTENDGTSYAAPFAAATAALVRQRFPDLSAAEVVARIVATADPAPGGRHSDAYGNGVVNPYRAITETISPGQPVPAAALQVRPADPVAQARRELRATAQRQALWLAGTAALAVATVLGLAVVLPRGTRRRWRPAAPR